MNWFILGVYTAFIVGIFITTMFIKFSDGNCDKNSWHANIYRFLYAKSKFSSLPENVCKYFRYYVIGFMITPLTLPYLIYARVSKEPSENVVSLIGSSIVAYILIFISCFIGILVTSPIIIYFESFFKSISGTNLDIIVTIVYFILSAIIGFLLIYFAITLIEKVDDKIKERAKNKRLKKQKEEPKELKEPKEPKINLLVQRFKNWKERNCTIITWK